jgi:hypothetical protein
MNATDGGTKADPRRDCNLATCQIKLSSVFAALSWKKKSLPHPKNPSDVEEEPAAA